LNRVAVVNQTTLLVNETREIISYLREIYTQLHGPAGADHVGGSGRTDTLCYATQVNQDALAKALATPIDAAFVIGGKNSSNTYQLYRLCEQAVGTRAYFIQSEANILSVNEVEHFVFPSHHDGRPHGMMIKRDLWSDVSGPKRVLITGGASCPDGIIQQVITRLNSLFPLAELRNMDAILAEFAPTVD
jgi:4-hydroxy-3-methylbut-2-en-1-yl diphosphate reductase